MDWSKIISLSIPRDLINIITQYVYVDRLLRRIEEMGIDSREFCEKLHKYKCLIAGGSVVEAVVGGFKNGERSRDIDIYLNDDPRLLLDVNRYPTDIEQELRCVMCRNHPHHPIHPFEHWLWHHLQTRKIKLKSNTGCQSQPYSHDYIIGVRDLKSEDGSLNIQCVMCKSEHPLNYYIDQMFDLEVCKSKFDGVRIYSSHLTTKYVSTINPNTKDYEGNNNGTIADWEIEPLYWNLDYANCDLFSNKYHPFDFEWWMGSHNRRLTNDKRANELARQLLILKRVRKYEKRGFKIMVPTGGKKIEF